MKQSWLPAVVLLLLLLQLAFLVAVVVFFADSYPLSKILFYALSFFVMLFVISTKSKPAYKLLWVILLLGLPAFGGIFYLYVTLQTSTRWFNKKQTNIQQKTRKHLVGEHNYLDDVTARFYNLPRYLQDFAGFPIYPNTQALYLSPGEEKFHCLLQELKRAKKYIYLEYFIIAQGKMWDSILEVLKQQVQNGVEVRVLYDDLGCLLLLPSQYPKYLQKLGIQCRVFNKFRPYLTTLQNNRDHRKIAVIDGNVAFTGGVNLADEYINAKVKYGHWKDASIMLKGEGAWTFAVMFLEMWELCGGDTESIADKKPDFSKLPPSCDGYVQPYFDSPTDAENIGEQVYMHIITTAQRYLYISTPYFIVDDAMLSAITLASKSGVDVRIMTPHIGDKFLVHCATRSYYQELINAGVKIYEYKKGFVHSKIFIADDVCGTVGSTNMDFRSLYLHFECGVCIYNSSVVASMKEDFLVTLHQSKVITKDLCRHSAPMVLLQELLRIFAPLM